MSKSTADLMNWRETYKGPEQSQENLDFWNMLRKRSIDNLSIIGMMPGVFQSQSLIGPPTAQNPAPGGAMPTQSQVAQAIYPGFSGFSFPKTGAATTSQTDLLAALKTLVDQPGFEQLGPLLESLGKG